MTEHDPVAEAALAATARLRRIAEDLKALLWAAAAADHAARVPGLSGDADSSAQPQPAGGA